MHAYGTKFTKDKRMPFPVLSNIASLQEANNVPSFLILSISINTSFLYSPTNNSIPFHCPTPYCFLSTSWNLRIFLVSPQRGGSLFS